MAHRLEPALPASAMKTYRIVQTHRPATCQEVDCPAYLHGWRADIDVSTDLGHAQARYIRRGSGRTFTETALDAPGMVRFEFQPGQRCFRSDDHRLPVEAEPLYLVQGGDHRGNPRGTGPVRHHNAIDWRDDFAEHQQNLADRLAQG